MNISDDRISQAESLRVRVIGAGPTGSVLALSLANKGAEVYLYEKNPIANIKSRNRAYAITHSSRRLFQDVGIWDELEKHLQSFSILRIQDKEIHKQIDITLDDLCSNNRSYNSVGWILEHRILMDILMDKVLTNKNISLFEDNAPHANDSTFNLTIAADGGNSSSRHIWRSKSLGFSYKQGCLTSKVLIRGANPSTAYEIFSSEGPLAILPMGGEVFQVVWSAPLIKCYQREGLTESEFLDRLSSVLPCGLQPDVLLDQPKAFQIRFGISSLPKRSRSILVGEAFHRCHPVGGQGLNLCWRDIATLSKLINNIIKGNLNINNVPIQFLATRFIDILFINFFTDVIIRVFSNRNPFLLFYRRLSFVILKRFLPIRRLLISMMTDGF